MKQVQCIRPKVIDPAKNKTMTLLSRSLWIARALASTALVLIAWPAVLAQSSQGDWFTTSLAYTSLFGLAPFYVMYSIRNYWHD